MTSRLTTQNIGGECFPTGTSAPADQSSFGTLQGLSCRLVTIALWRSSRRRSPVHKLSCNNYFSNAANNSGTELKMFLSERVEPQKATYFFSIIQQKLGLLLNAVSFEN